MELAVGVTIRQLLHHLHCASEFEAPSDAGVSSDKSLLGVTDDKLRARLWLVGQQMLLSRQITVDVGVGVRIWATIWQVGKQVPLFVVRAKSTLFLHHGVHLKTNSEMYGHEN